MAARGDRPAFNPARGGYGRPAPARSRAAPATRARRVRAAAAAAGCPTVAIDGERIHQVAAVHAAQQFALRGGGGIAQMHAHQESVQLRFGQRKGPGLILRVLRGDDEEGFGQRHGLAVEGDLMLFHGLEQCTLRLGRGSIDFIGEHQLRENRAALKPELAGLAVENGHAQHIGGQQIAGELDALEGQPQGLGNGMRERGLADARECPRSADGRAPAGRPGTGESARPCPKSPD